MLYDPYARAIQEEFGAVISDDAEVVVKARIEDDLCTLSIDSSGESLHKRGHKEGIGKATDNASLEAEGKAQKLKGSAQDVKGSVKGTLGDDI